MVIEVPKVLKILWIANIIIAIIHGIIYIFLPEATFLATQPYSTAAATLSRSLGISLFAFAIITTRAIMINDWEQIRLYAEYAILWMGGMIILGIWALTSLPIPAANIVLNIILIAGYIGFIIPYIYYYIQLRE
ncbi:MAG: hypothetical protein HWN67_08605 [Candidatus Helarchaeota archaeon]|nr:hypothetical protein [Candidatus Helarchaeota archaeon]